MSAFPISPELEAAVIANADEDTPRLAYADWLDEHGDPDRAEFIRLQIRIANASPAHDNWFDLLEREEHLVFQLEAKFREVHSTLPSGVYVSTVYFPRSEAFGSEEQFDRGFPFFCSVRSRDWTPKNTEEFAEQLGQLVATTTFRGVSFAMMPPARFAELVATPAFEQLRGVSFAFNGNSPWQTEFETAAYKKLIESPVSQRLVQLTVSGVLGAHGVKVLAAGQPMRALRKLSIQYSLDPSPELRKLISPEMFPELREVQCTLGEQETAQTLVPALGELSELHTLTVYHLAVANASQLVPGRFPRLVHLKTFASDLRTKGFLALLRAKWFERLRILDVGDSELGDKAVLALVKHPVAASLRDLRFTPNALTKSGLMVFTQPGAFPELLRLEMSGSGRKANVTNADVTAFLAALNLPRLRELNLGRLPVGESGAKAIAANPAFAQLTKLFLVDCQISEDGAKALAESPVGKAVVM
ncbi:MAG: TIGR02996 domain-containing protein [Gemmataceae bacterium]